MLRLIVGVSILVLGATCAKSYDDFFEADPGCVMILSSDGRAYCQVDGNSGRVTLHTTESGSTTLPKLLKADGEIRQLEVNESFTFSYLLTSRGLFSFSLTEGVTSEIQSVVVPLPPNFKIIDLRILAISNSFAVVSSSNSIALVSTDEWNVLNSSVMKSYFAIAVSCKNAIIYSPAHDCEIASLRVRSDINSPLLLQKITTFGNGGACTPYLRFLKSNCGKQNYQNYVAGIVQYFEASPCPKSDALMIWIGDTVLDIDRAEDYRSCVGLAVYDLDVCALFKPIVTQDTSEASVVTWSISDKQGLVRRRETKVALRMIPSTVTLDPTKPCVVALSQDRQRIQRTVLKEK